MSNRRIMIVGTNSGCGKTTVTCALLSALKTMGVSAAPFKCGPDYIDPMFHKYITGKPSVNLDAFFLDEKALKMTLGRRLKDCEIGILEGVMGMYDGIGTEFLGSAFDIAVKTDTPMILTVNAKGMSLSVAALIYGYKKFAQEMCKSEKGSSLIRGVILNQVGTGMAAYLKDAIEQKTGVKVLGCFEQQAEAVFESRHLGLVTAGEIANLDKKLKALGEAAKRTIDFKTLFEIAETAAPLETEGVSKNYLNNLIKDDSCPAGGEPMDSLKLAVAQDAAFCFYYEDNLQLFKDLGIEIVPFSPLDNEPVPEGVSGIYLGGGYPEIYAERLAKNEVTKASVKAAFKSEMPMIAECGGFMYLHEQLALMDGTCYPMVGAISGTAGMTKKLGPFGYIHIKLKDDGLLGEKGDVLKGHEFHYSASDNGGDDFEISKPNGRQWAEGHSKNWLYAGYPHLYLPGFVKSALFFKRAMISYNKRD